jgi:Common central domain of tyrosinase/Polyphenol oxidase middle domain
MIQDPHGNVHGEVGGWMCCVPTSAQDPIFYLHHANVDRQWNLWLAQGGGRTDPLGDTTWKNRQYTFFEENGAQVQMTACEILRAAAQLNYVYECEPPQVTEYCLRIFPPPWVFQIEVLLHVPISPVELQADPVTFASN